MLSIDLNIGDVVLKDGGDVDLQDGRRQPRELLDRPSHQERGIV